MMNKSLWMPDDIYKYSLSAILIILCAVLIVLYSRLRNVTWNNLPPGSSGWPIIGETLPFIMNGNTYMSERIAKYGSVFRSSLLGQNMIIISGADNVRPILLGEGSTVQVEQTDSTRSLFGQGTLYSSKGTEHNDLHKFVTKTFHNDNLRDVTPHVQTIIRETVHEWRKAGHVTSGLAEVKKLAFSISTKVLLGMDFSSTEIDCVISLFATFNDAFFSFPVNLPGFAYQKGKQARIQLLDLIGKHLSDLANKPKDHRINLMKDIMERHLAIDSQKLLDDNGNMRQSGNLKNIALELMFGSHATIASCLCAVLMYLGNQPEVFNAVRLELEASGICQHQTSEEHDHVITYEEVKSMTYVHHVVKEILRLSPPIAGSFRRTLQPMKIAGYDIPKGWCLLYHVTSTHKLSPLFADERDQFKPERWQKADSQVDDHAHTWTNKDNPRDSSSPVVDQLRSDGRFHYIPYGAGQRRCVGKEFANLVIMLFIIETVRTGKWHLVNGFPKMKTCPIVYPDDGLPLQFEQVG